MSTELKTGEFYVTRRGDNRKSPEIVKVRRMTYDELKTWHPNLDILDRNGKMAHVKVTSVKTWKRRPDVEIHCKYGLYEYFTVTVTPDRQQNEFVKIIDD